jgi:hypothetical protein
VIVDKLPLPTDVTTHQTHDGVDKAPTSRNTTTKEPLNGSQHGHHAKNIKIINVTSANSMDTYSGIALNTLALIAGKPVVINRHTVPNNLDNTMEEILKSDVSPSNRTPITQTHSSNSQNTPASTNDANNEPTNHKPQSEEEDTPNPI